MSDLMNQIILLSLFRWTIKLNPNRDGSLMLNRGLNWQYYEELNTGVRFTQLNRDNQIKCQNKEDQTMSTGCRDIAR
jgi:hypothetical protein